MAAKFYISLFLCGLALLMPISSHARPMVADLHPRKIEISHDFLGTEILVYGVRNDAGNIIVVVRGPKKKYLVREKKKIAGIWLNGDALRFNDVSSFYSMAIMGDLNRIRNDNLLEKLAIGADNQKFFAIGKAAKEVDVEKFTEALKAELAAQNLFNATPVNVSFWGETLFRSIIDFPKNVLPGVYNVDVYLFNDGLLSSVQSTPLIVDKVGFEAFVYDFAHKNSGIYGLVCVLLAILCGFAARFLFVRH
jgi:uncharacterized protein (TIGR02186 family)